MALALGAMALRLSNLFGAHRLAETQSGMPDGYAGLSARGSFDRLLVSEWALLEEAPDEFIRRAASGELAFLRLAFRERAAGLRCVALFDAGIEQLGAPRLVQLALMIVLARRCELQRASFEWGVLQDAEPSLHAGLNAAGVRRLLAAHCARAVATEDVARWHTLLGDGPGELWLIGGESVAAHALQLSAASVVLCDRLDPGLPPRVHVKVTRRAEERAHEAVLELPAASLGVRMLREPFWGAQPPRALVAAEIDARVNLLFAADSRRIYAVGGERLLLSFPVPNSPNAAPGAPAQFYAPANQRIVAVAREASSKRNHVLCEGDGELIVHMLSKRGATMVSTERFRGGPALALPATKLAPFAVLGHEHYAFLDGSGQLIELRDGQATSRAQEQVLTVRALKDSLAWATLDHAVPKIRLARRGLRDVLEIDSPRMRERPPPRWGTAPFYFGPGLNGYAYQSGPRVWTLVDNGSSAQVEIDEAVEVCGLVYVERKMQIVGTERLTHRPMLLALDASRLRLELLPAEHRMPLYTCPAPVLQVEVDHQSRLVAMLCASGELLVLDTLHGQLVARWEGTLLT